MPKPYRKCVVAVVTKDFKTFLVGERQRHPGAWQFPQGGIDEGEAPVQAALRELKEETGTDQVELVREAADWVSYDFPEDMEAPIAKDYRGQTQKWFLFQMAVDHNPDLEESDHEFRALDWRSLESILSGIVAWKRDVYVKGARILNLEGGRPDA